MTAVRCISKSNILHTSRHASPILLSVLEMSNSEEDLLEHELLAMRRKHLDH